MNDILTNGTEIKQRIISEIQNARQSIYLAMAWFTDRDIANVIINAKNKSLTVEIILSSNAQNETVKQMFSEGNVNIHAFETGDERGMMHHKFCLIDQRITINGSYNYSYNASNNNVENIQVSDDPHTYRQFFSEFERLKYNIDHQIDVNTAIQTLGNNNKQETNKSFDQSSDLKSDYEKVLDSMIASEISSFNRNTLKQQGFDRAQGTNGDHNVLEKALDTLYNGFINDIDIIEDKKKRLLAKIDEQKAKSLSQFQYKFNSELLVVETEFEILKNNLDNKVINIKADIQIAESNIKDLKENKLNILKKRIDEIEANIHSLLNFFVKPGLKWFELITTGIFSLALLIYLQIFYSSAAYILLYSEEDAKIALKTTSEPVSPQIFNPNAFSKASDHGTMALIFVCLFVFIPLIFASLERIMTNKTWAKILTYGFGLLLVDSFIAIKIAQSIHEIKSQTELQPKPWDWVDLLSDTNFYLVFILGAFGILLFKFCFEKLNRLADERNPDIAEQKNKILVKNQREDIRKISAEISFVNSEIEIKNQEVMHKESLIELTKTELENLPIRKLNQLEKQKNELSSKSKLIEVVTDIYKSHVENDNTPVSVDALKDRINIFLEGWSEFLFQEYANTKASEKSKNATAAALNWEYNKVNKNYIDTRIKNNK